MEEALRGKLEALSEKPLEDIARKTSSVSYNEGRGAEIESLAERGAIEYVVRSEILDERTCEVCAGLDGAVVEVGAPEYAELMSPNKCLGEERCRGFYVPLGSEQAGLVWNPDQPRVPAGEPGGGQWGSVGEGGGGGGDTGSSGGSGGGGGEAGGAGDKAPFKWKVTKYSDEKGYYEAEMTPRLYNGKKRTRP